MNSKVNENKEKNDKFCTILEKRFISNESDSDKNENLIEYLNQIFVIFESQNFNEEFLESLNNNILNMSDDEYSFFSEKFPYECILQILFHTENQQILNHCLEIIGTLSSTESNIFEELFGTEVFADFLMSQFANHNENSYDSVLHIIASLCYKNRDLIYLFYSKELFNILPNIKLSSYTVNILSYALDKIPESEALFASILLAILQSDDIDPFFAAMKELSIIYLQTENEALKDEIISAFIASAPKIINFDDDETTISFLDFLSLINPNKEFPIFLCNFMIKKISMLSNDPSKMESNTSLIRSIANCLTVFSDQLKNNTNFIDSIQHIQQFMLQITDLKTFDYRSYICCICCLLEYADNDLFFNDSFLEKMIENAEDEKVFCFLSERLVNIFMQSDLTDQPREYIYEALSKIEILANEYSKSTKNSIAEKAQNLISFMDEIERNYS